jgi:hypothetical protein
VNIVVVGEDAFAVYDTLRKALVVFLGVYCKLGGGMRTCTHLFRTLCSRRSEVINWSCAGRHSGCVVQYVCKCAVYDDEVRTGVNGWLAACRRTDGLAAATCSRLGLVLGLVLLATRHNTTRLDALLLFIFLALLLPLPWRQRRQIHLRSAYALTRRSRLAPPMLSRTRPPQPRVYVHECHPP